MFAIKENYFVPQEVVDSVEDDLYSDGIIETGLPIEDFYALIRAFQVLRGFQMPVWAILCVYHFGVSDTHN